jgi:hypothetical protein
LSSPYWPTRWPFSRLDDAAILGLVVSEAADAAVVHRSANPPKNMRIIFNRSPHVDVRLFKCAYNAKKLSGQIGPPIIMTDPFRGKSACANSHRFAGIYHDSKSAVYQADISCRVRTVVRELFAQLERLAN